MYTHAYTYAYPAVRRLRFLSVARPRGARVGPLLILHYQ